MQTWFARGILLVSLLLLIVTLAALSTFKFALSTLADPKYPVSQEIMGQAATLFAFNAPIQAKAAAQIIEVPWQETQDYQEAALEAVKYAEQAISLNSNNYEYHLLAAHGYEAVGNLPKSSEMMQKALSLAPTHTNVHWQYANLLLRQNQVAAAGPSFYRVVNDTPERIPAILNLIWQTDQGNIALLNQVTRSSPQAQLNLAQFLVKQNRIEEGMRFYKGVSPDLIPKIPGASGALDELIKAGAYDAAYQLWQHVFPEVSKSKHSFANGGFETRPKTGWQQFDWQISSNPACQIGIVNGNAHSGNLALQLFYKNVDTTTLKDNVKILVPVIGGTRYRLIAFYKAEKLSTPDSPIINVLDARSGASLGASSELTRGTHDWQRIEFDFLTASDAQAVFISIRQTPAFKFTEASTGTIWFDDFEIEPNP